MFLKHIICNHVRYVSLIGICYSGAMVDVTGTFILTFMTMGGGMAAAGLCIGIQPLVVKMAKSVNIELLWFKIYSKIQINLNLVLFLPILKRHSKCVR